MSFKKLSFLRGAIFSKILHNVNKLLLKIFQKVVYLKIVNFDTFFPILSFLFKIWSYFIKIFGTLSKYVLDFGVLVTFTQIHMHIFLAMKNSTISGYFKESPPENHLSI